MKLSIEMDANDVSAVGAAIGDVITTASEAASEAKHSTVALVLEHFVQHAAPLIMNYMQQRAAMQAAQAAQAKAESTKSGPKAV